MNNQIIVATKQELENLITKAVGKAISVISKTNGKVAFDVMNIEQVAEFLNMSVSTIYQKTSKNLIPHKKHGKKLYFIRQDIEKWIIEGSCMTDQEIEEQALDYVIGNSGRKR